MTGTQTKETRPHDRGRAQSVGVAEIVASQDEADALRAEVDTDSSAYFSSDRTAIRCTMRIGFAWPRAKAVTTIHIG
jgi:hypothetical protein